MPVTRFNHDKAKELGIDVNGRSSFPPECYIHTYIGCVLDTYEKNGRDDSDFYAIVWDEETQTCKNVEYASTRGWTYENSAHTDATDEVKAKATAYWKARHRASVEHALRRKYAEAHEGCTVKVIRGRKVPKGFTGTVANIELLANPYRPAPMFRSNAWDNRDKWLFVVNEKASAKVQAEYCEVVPDLERVEKLVAAGLAEFDANQARIAMIDFRSAPYQDLYLAGVQIPAGM